MRLLLALFAVGLLLLSVPAASTSMPMSGTVSEPVGVNVTGDDHAREAHAALAAADGAAPIPVPDNWARDKFAAAQAADTTAASPVTVPATDPAALSLLYAAVSVALLFGVAAVLAGRVPRFHMSHGT